MTNPETSGHETSFQKQDLRLLSIGLVCLLISGLCSLGPGLLLNLLYHGRQAVSAQKGSDPFGYQGSPAQYWALMIQGSIGLLFWTVALVACVASIIQDGGIKRALGVLGVSLAMALLFYGLSQMATPFVILNAQNL